MKKLLFLIATLPFSAFGTVWYVDCNATNGTSTGISWANAWTNISSIVWTSLNPGDFVEISGGTYWAGSVRNYDKAGTYGNPITLRASRTNGHNSKVIMYGGFTTSKSYITFDGSKSDVIENTLTNTIQVMNVPTNCNWVIYGYYPGFSSTNSPFQAIVDGGAIGLHVKGIEVVCDIPRFMMPSSWPASDTTRAQGTPFLFGSGTIVSNVLVEYCWIHDCAWNGFTRYGGQMFFGLAEMRYNLMETLGQDYFEHSSGWDIHHNIMHGSKRTVGHQDGIVINAGNTRAWNNIMYDLADTTPFFPTVNVSNAGSIFFYGNVVFCSQWDSGEPVSTALNVTAEDVSRDPPDQLIVILTNNPNWHDFYFINNTVHVTNMLQGAAFSVVNTKYPATRFVLTNWNHFNNLYVNDCFFEQANSGFGGDGSVYPAGSGTTGQVDQIHVNYNNISGSSATRRQFSYMGTNYNASTFNSAMPNYKSNYSTFPTFVDIARHDYRLATSDTGARGLGTNLSALAASLPGIEHDIYGNYRGAGQWDIGALVYSVDQTALPATPVFVEVSKGTYSNGVYVAWNTVAGASYYSLWRIEGTNAIDHPNESVIASRVTPPNYTSTSWLDGVPLNQTNTYWVRAENAYGWSMLSAYTNGYTSTNSQTSTNTYGNEDIIWHLTADNLDTSGLWHDLTTNRHDVVRMWDATNWPVKLTGITDGAPYLTNAASFTNYGGSPEVGMFGAMTNLFRMTNLSAITVMVWAKYYDGADGTEKFVSSTYGTNSTWFMGREYALQTSFNINTNIQGDNDGNPLHINFQDNSDTIYHFYVGIFDVASQLMEVYQDGTNYWSADFTGYFVNNITSWHPYTVFDAPGKFGWWGVGVNTHDGSPQRDGDGFPNNAWFSGELQELVVLNRRATSNEVNHFMQTGTLVENTNPVTHVVTVNSSGPTNGVSVTNTLDNVLVSNGVTSYTLTYNEGTSVTLTAPLTYNSTNLFTNWNRGSSYETTNLSTTFVVQSNTTFTAVFLPAAVPIVTNHVTANRVGVPVRATPSDVYDQSTGTVSISFAYYSNSIVTLSVPYYFETNSFFVWLRNGVPCSHRTNATFTANANNDNFLVLYAGIPVETTNYTLIVTSSPIANILVTCTPDTNGVAGGFTPFNLYYTNAIGVELTAQTSVGTNTFEKWVHDGTNYAFTPTTIYGLDASTTLEAVYTNNPPSTPAPSGLKVHSGQGRMRGTVKIK